MKKLEELYQLAKDENIEVEKVRLGKSNGLYFNVNNNFLIFIDNRLDDSILEKCILAEELGHHFAGVIPNSICDTDYINNLERSKNEFNALKWASNKLVPLEVLQCYCGRTVFLYEVAEDLRVTEEFLERVYNYYREKGELI